jgi:hypothetical protein
MANCRSHRPAITLAAPWVPFAIIFENFGTASFRKWVAEMTPSKAVQGLRELVRVQHDQAHEILSARKDLLASGHDLDNAAGSGNDILTLLSKPRFRVTSTDSC